MHLILMLGSQLHVGTVWGRFENRSSLSNLTTTLTFEQDGPLLVLNGVLTPINNKRPRKWVIGVKTPVYKWSYNPTYNLSGAHFVWKSVGDILSRDARGQSG